MRGSNYVYVGHYTDIDGNYILKVGTTNNIKRRTYEHTATYKRKKKYQMPKDERFVMDSRPELILRSISLEEITRNELILTFNGNRGNLTKNTDKLNYIFFEKNVKILTITRAHS